MNAASWLILDMVVLAVILAVRYLLEHGDSCSGSCAGCGGSCRWQRDLAKAQRHIQRQKKLKRLFGIR